MGVSGSVAYWGPDHSRCTRSSSNTCSLSCLPCDWKTRKNRSGDDDESEFDQPDKTNTVARKVKMKTNQRMSDLYLKHSIATIGG